MNVLIATPLYPPDVGGPATYTALMEKALPPKGITVTVLSWGRVRSFPPIVRHLVYFVSLILHARGKDVIYALDPVSTGLPAALAAFFLRKRFLLRIAGDFAWEQLKQTHNLQPTTDNKNEIENFVDPIAFQKKKFDWLTELRRAVEHFVARRAYRIITPSNYLKNVIGMWGVEAKRIHVIHNSVQDLSHIGNKELIRDMLGVKGHLVMTAGRLIPLKGIDALIGILPALKKQFPDIVLVIAGDGPDRERLVNLAKISGVSDHIVFTGALQQDVLHRYIKAADVFVLNSWHETFPNVLLEALSLETPVIATHSGGIPEIIDDRKEGRLIQPRDNASLEKAIKELFADGGAIRSYIQAAKRKVQQFDKVATVDKTVELIKAICTS